MHHPRRALALVVSLAMHAVVVVSVAQRSLPPPPAPPTREPAMTWVDVEPQPAAAPPPLPPMVPPALHPPRRATTREVHAPAPPAAAAPASTTTPREPAADAPRGLSTLLPRAVDAPTAPLDAPHGVTLHPGDEPGERELKEEETARVTARVDGLLHHGLARAHVANGLVDPAFTELRHRLVEATKDVPDLIGLTDPRKVVGAVGAAWLTGADRYGRTGQAYAEPEGYREALERPSALVEAAARGSPDAIKLQQFLSAGARLQEFADGRSGVELVALVEVFASPQGALESLSLTQSSGVKAFDDYVLGSARGVTSTFSLDAGSRTRPMRSVWRFGGVVTFRRKVSSLKDVPAWSLLGNAALSLLSGGLVPAGGRFDETTGEVDVIDLTHPRYTCTVSLLEAE